jgi:hypothetical protein
MTGTDMSNIDTTSRHAARGQPILSPYQPTRFLKLPLAFDAVQLQQDLASINAAHWASHFNTNDYDNGWRGVALRSVGGQTSLIPVHDAAYKDTPLLAACPYFVQVLAQFECEKSSVRLLALDAGGSIKPHRDSGTSLEGGITRLHIPIQTSEQVVFCIDGEQVHFTQGHTWYLNASCEHSAHNPTTTSRIHLVLDCVTTPWLEHLFAAAGGSIAPPHPYPDANINDTNVTSVIERLRAGGHASGLRLALELGAIYAGRRAA